MSTTKRLKAFEDVFLRGGWNNGNGETVSGAGSTLNYTARLRTDLGKLFQDLEVRSVLDVPCGDFNWFRKLDLRDISYHGIDIVPGIIASNSEKFGGEGVRFSQGDATTDPLPKADLMICRDLLRHLPIDDIQAVLRKFAESQTPWLLVTSYVVPTNADIDTFIGSRPINLKVAPFHLPEPKLSMPDFIDGFRERYMCLWSRNALIAAIASWNVSPPEKAG